jgi:GT2 family glycosyltransferase
LSFILHITPQLSPGRCGVSDYALEWIDRQSEEGTPGKILALCDRFHPGKTMHEQGIRLGADVPVSQKLVALKSALAEAPMAVVFHYVPMGYHARALPFWLLGLIKLLNALSCPLVMVLHELWAGGTDKPLPLRGKGSLQKWFLLHLLRQLPHARLITTSAYTSVLLRRYGMHSDWCPVFSNLGASVQLSGLPQPIKDACADPKMVRVILFGSLPPEGTPAMVASLLKQMVERYKKPVQVWHAGHGYQQDWWQSVQKWLTKDKNDIRFAALGPLPAPALNALMQNAHFGISTYPIELWSKSGSIAAMRANGLPVLIPGSLAQALPLSGFTLPEGLYHALPLNTEKSLEEIKKPADPVLYNRQIAERLFALFGFSAGKSLSAMPCSVIITVYRSWHLAYACVLSVLRWLPHARIGEIVLVHDDPAEKAPEWTQTLPLCRVLQNTENVGYVASVQKGMEAAQYELVLLLDADAAITGPAVDALDLLANAPDLHMVVPGATDLSGKAVPRFYMAPSGLSLWLGQKAESFWHQFSKAEKMVSHSYAWFLRRHTFLAIGGFDTNFRFLEADVDFSIRLHALFSAGVAYYPKAIIAHQGGANPVTRNQRVMDWYASRWYLLQKQGKIKHSKLLRYTIRFRLMAEQLMALLLAKLLPGKKLHWQQKAAGRKGLYQLFGSGFSN